MADFIYLEESGDIGFKFDRGSSRYFIVTLMLIADQIPMQNAIDDLRKELRYPDNVEFKFSKSSNAVRLQFLSTLRRLEFSAVSLVADKHDFAEYRELGHAALYAKIVETLLLECQDLFNGATLIVDQSTKSRRQQQALATRLRSALNGGEGPIRLGKILHHDSRRDNLIQAADMISGAVNAAFARGDRSYLIALRPRSVRIIEVSSGRNETPC